jgi:hypothetical protein
LHQQKFFLFLVERNSANFTPPRPRKSLADDWLVSGSGAKLPEFRSGGGAKLFPGGAKFAAVSHQFSAVGCQPGA